MLGYLQASCKWRATERSSSIPKFYGESATSGWAMQWFDLEAEPWLLEGDVPSASVCTEHEQSQVSPLLVVSITGVIYTQPSFLQNCLHLVSFGLNGKAGWRLHAPGLNANAVPGAGRRAGYSFPPKMCLWECKELWKLIHKHKVVFPGLLPCPYCPLFLPTLLYNSGIWNQEMRPYWKVYLTGLLWLHYT